MDSAVKRRVKTGLKDYKNKLKENCSIDSKILALNVNYFSIS